MGAAASMPSTDKEQDQLYISDTKPSPSWKSASTDPRGWKEKEGEQSQAQTLARRRQRRGESPPERTFCLKTTKIKLEAIKTQWKNFLLLQAEP